MDTHEFNEIPELLEHYQDHKQRADGKEVSFVDFIAMHYLNAKHDQSENHTKLPFKDQHHSCSCPFFSVLPSFDFSIHVNYHVTPSFTVPDDFNSYYLGNIWQPPQLV